MKSPYYKVIMTTLLSDIQMAEKVQSLQDTWLLQLRCWHMNALPSTSLLAIGRLLAMERLPYSSPALTLLAALSCRQFIIV